jgi:hypothetical protein
VKDLNFYNEEMSKSLADKAFFMDHIDVNHLVDYGCADGRLGEFLVKVKSAEIDYSGFDISTEMLESSRKRNPDLAVHSNFEKLVETVNQKETTLVANSVLHEMYSEGVESEFFKHAKLLRPKYIAIRDMFLLEELKRTESKSNHVAAIHQYLPPNMIDDYQDYVGSMKTYKYLIQLIFKARFRANWKTELSDDYFAINRATLFFILDLLGYETIYQEDYALPFLKNHALETYGIEIYTDTHFKWVGRLRME